MLILFEGRDAAGKGGTINAVREYMNPRTARERGAAQADRDRTAASGTISATSRISRPEGEFVTFDRSWYNRAGVEPVMGFCTPDQYKHFLKETPRFEKMIVGEGIRFFKFWLDVSQEMQLKRFHDRRHSPLTNWKFSPMDIAGIARWDAYTKARNEMLEETHTEHAPWIVVRSNDKRRARIEVIRHVLRTLDYAGRDLDKIGKPDEQDHRLRLEAGDEIGQAEAAVDGTVRCKRDPVKLSGGTRQLACKIGGGSRVRFYYILPRYL